MTLVIYGPTVSGKTDLAISLAKKLNGELISADSRQVYQGLDIGTGKVSPGAKVTKHQGYWIVDGIKINGFDLVQPQDNFSAADFVKFAKEKIKEIQKSKKLPIIVGGTGFYIKSSINGIPSSGVGQNPELRQNLEKLSVSQLYQKLQLTDPIRAKQMNQSDSKNPRRLIRAIEIATQNQNLKIKNQRLNIRNWKLEIGNYLIIGLTAPNEYLYKRADNWVDKRLELGMIEESQNLIDHGVDQQWLDNLGLEYKWISRYLSGKTNKEEAIKRLKGDIHDFIRRQKTWFTQLKTIKIYDITSPNFPNNLEKQVSLWYTSKDEE